MKISKRIAVLGAAAVLTAGLAACGGGEQQAGGQQAGPKALHRLSPHSVPRAAAGRLGAIRVRKRRISSGASFAYSTP